MASDQSHDALDLPIYGARYNMQLVWLDADGDPTAPTSLDIEISKDNGTFANCTNSAVLAKEVGGVTDSPYGYITLTETEMTAETVKGQAKDATVKATPFLIKPKRFPVVRDSQAQAGGNSSITLDASASAIDDYYNGAVVLLDADTGSGQARRIIDYVGSTQVATIAGTWETNPDATTDFQVLATPEWGLNPVVLWHRFLIGTAGEAEDIAGHASFCQLIAMLGCAHKRTQSDDGDGTGIIKVFKVNGSDQLGNDLGITTAGSGDVVTGTEDTV